uniref:Uncharacterized protein n=1 Tax=uncultured bacterium contig00100 TaxID=1181567 RepID=A0A806KI00_9BACT|nr:hypothetical protein [uncultured bacterium contig00100]
MVYENVQSSKEDIIIENDYLHLRFLPATAEIILTEKATGIQWRSNPPNASSDPNADVVTGQFMESQFTLEYADATGVSKTLYSGINSVTLGNYDYNFDGNTIEVRYTVGNISRSYIIPPAAPEERMRPYLEQMELDDRRKVEAGYRLYDINNLRSSDDRNILIANYPDLSRTRVYVLRDNTQEFMKELFEGYFAAAGYTYEDYFEDASRYPSATGADKPAFNVTLQYSLDGKSLVVKVPFDKIAWRSTFPIAALNLLPYMGAGGLDDKGYLLVPDGSGALIYFNNGKQNQNVFSVNVYGWDEAMPRDAVISDNKAPYPAFGIQKNGHAFLGVIEEGSAYAAVRADVSGRNSSWNYVHPRFEILHGAEMEISGRSDRAVYLYERTLPAGENITVRYTVCDRDGYVGMAKQYRSRLLERFPSLSGSRDGGRVPIAVEVVGAVNKTMHRLGIPADRPLKLTSYKETQYIIEDFADFGWKNVNIKLNGWFNRSVEHTPPTKVKLIRELGSKKDFKKMVSTAEKNGFGIFPEADFLYIKDVKPFGGFSLYRDAARYVSRKRIEKYPYSFVWFGERTFWGKLSYISRPESMMRMIDGFSKKTTALGMKNISFRNLAAVLSGDYNEKRAVSREASMKMRQQKLEQLSASGTGILLHTGYAYAAPWADFITDIALDSQGFGICDVSVPFYSIVLHGLVPYTGRAINLAEDYTKNLLKTIEGGAGLYFSFMIEETAVLQETKFRQFYANEYHKWKNDADALYQKFRADFDGLYDQGIADHQLLPQGVTATVYEDGTRVIVNAGDNSWNYNGSAIAARSYLVLRQGE